MTKGKRDSSYTMIAMVAIVAIVAIFVLLLNNVNPRTAYSTTEPELQQALIVDEEGNIIGEAKGGKPGKPGDGGKPKTCTDSDGGLAYYTSGYVTLGDQAYYDECSGSNLQVNEKYCYTVRKKPAVGTMVYTCPYGCQGGACLNTSPTYCGNGIVETGEECDGNYRTCVDYAGRPGMQNCTPNCTWGQCIYAGYCGDGIQVPPEECDEDDLGGMTCVDLGNFTGGVLACDTATCMFDTSGCIS